MRTADALALYPPNYGAKKRLAQALNVTVQAVSQWSAKGIIPKGPAATLKLMHPALEYRPEDYERKPRGAAA